MAPDVPGGRSPKLSPRARQLIEGAPSTDDAPEPDLDLLIRTATEIGDDERGRIQAAGAEVRTVAGDVLTASAPLSALDRLAELDDVIAIDVAEPLWPERPSEG